MCINYVTIIASKVIDEVNFDQGDKIIREGHRNYGIIDLLVRSDYLKNPSPPEMSGSIHQVHENSPILKTKKERLMTFTSPKKVDKK